MKTREWSNLIFIFISLLKTAFFGHILKKIQYFPFQVHGHSSWFTPSEGLKGSMKLIIFVKKTDHGSWTIKKAIFHDPTS